MYLTYQEFEENKIKCRKCPVGPVYNKVVCSVGNKIDPTFMLIGEAPGSDEIEKGEPFVGKAGQCLRPYLIKYGLNKKNTLISNTLPCRPQNNAFPVEKDIVHNCVSMWIHNEIFLTKPKYILLVGSQAMRYVLGLNESITQNRGKVITKTFCLASDKNNEFSDLCNPTIKCIITFHPSYVLRKDNMQDGKVIRDQFESDIFQFSQLSIKEESIITF